MKRQQDRETSPRSKRSRSSYSIPDHDSMRDRISPEFDRRDRGGKFSKSYPPRRDDFDRGDMDHPRKHFRDDRMMDQGYAPSRDQSKTHEYRSLCISSIPSKIPDPLLRDTLLQEFKKYGEMNVKVTVSGDQRVAYVNFRYPEHARIAKHAKGKLILFDRQVRVDPVFNKRTRSSSPNSEYNPREQFYGHSQRMGSGGSPPPMHMMGNRRGAGRGGGGGGGGGGGSSGGGDRNPMPQRDFSPRGGDNFAAQANDRRAPNEKFPHHLDHVDPEFDDKATRTLFVGNLDVNITESELKRIFEKYGTLDDIDIKRPQRGQGNAYAFLKFANLDCAHKAKVDMSGKYIGKFQCKIGYGKVTPTTCLWVGGLGPWVSYDTLEREFDRFGVIHRIEWPHGKSYAYVLYDGVDAATAACQDMRGWPMGGHNRRLRVDFADPNQISATVEPDSPYQDQGRGFEDKVGPWRGQGSEGPGERRSRRDDWHGSSGDPTNTYRNPDNPRDSDRRGRDDWDRFSDHSDRHRRPRSPGELGPHRAGRSRSPDRQHDYIGRDGMKDDHVRRISGDPGREFDDRMGRNGRRNDVCEKELNISDQVNSLNDLAKCLPVAWNGALILKSSSFAARMHVVSGDVTLVDNLMRDPTTTESPVLKITQRLRLDQPKLEDVGRRIQTSGPHGHCILLALPSTLQNYEDPSGAIQQRPLKNLVTYLKQKEAAGVISLPPNPTQDKNNIGVLHAFPPCSFGYSFLQKRAPQLPPDPAKEDYLVVVVVLGAA